LKSQRLNQILSNKKLGSSEIVNLLNEYYLSIQNKNPEIIKTVNRVKIKLGHFEAVNNYLDELNSFIKIKDKQHLLSFLKGYSIQEKKKIEIIFNKIYPRLKVLRSIITLSRSGTVLEILKMWHQKYRKIRVIICESRPMFEGRLFAEELAANGIKVELITDAMMGIYVNQVDAALIGADAVLKNGHIINKVGSKALALFCKEYKKSIYVVTARSKYSEKKIFTLKKQNPNEVWDKMIKNLSINNVYFEEVEKKLITQIFTD